MDSASAPEFPFEGYIFPDRLVLLLGHDMFSGPRETQCLMGEKSKKPPCVRPLKEGLE
jgi:hypothetical protein